MPNIRQLRTPTGDDDRLDTDSRRIAVQIAAQLPNDYGDAMRVLDLAKRIATEYLKD